MPQQSVIVRCPACSARNRVPTERLSENPRCGQCKTLLPINAKQSDGPFEATDATFEARVLNSALPVLIDCWAPWCAPCRMVGPILDDLARTWAENLRVGKLNVDQNPATAARFGIRSIPTLILFRHGREVDRLQGARPRGEIEGWLRSHMQGT